MENFDLKAFLTKWWMAIVALVLVLWFMMSGKKGKTGRKRSSRRRRNSMRRPMRRMRRRMRRPMRRMRRRMRRY